MRKQDARVRRAQKTRILIAKQNIHRLVIHRTNSHIYAQIFSPCGTRVLASASTLESEIKQEFASINPNTGSNITGASLIGKRIAQKAKSAGIKSVAFDRSGFRYHGRIKALAEAARQAGLKF